MAREVADALRRAGMAREVADALRRAAARARPHPAPVRTRPGRPSGYG
ncbi:hypothetical protein ACFW17_13355 [Streptomyces sp. NPDC058961]|nr:hypothetical protein [Streptomyces sp. MAG02]